MAGAGLKENGAIRTLSACIWLQDDGILHVVHDEGSVDTPENERALLAAGKRLIGEDRKALILGDITGLARSSREARAVGVSREVVEAVAAMAIITRSPVSRIIGNFFLSLNRPPYATRLFTSEEAALSWLKRHAEGSSTDSRGNKRDV